MNRKKIAKKFKGWTNEFCDKLICKRYLLRDIIIVSISITGALLLTVPNLIKKSQAPQGVKPVASREVYFINDQVIEDVRKMQEKVDTSGWKKYQNKWYGFEVKYPENWKEPTSSAVQAGDIWEYRYYFRSPESADGKVGYGFDVIVYSVEKIKELSGTAEFPKLKSEELKDNPECQNIEGHLLETGDYPAEEIYMPAGDDCFKPALFFSFTREQYIYNFTVVPNGDDAEEKDWKDLINHNFPEFYSVVETADLIDIVRPKPQPAKPKITAPHPASYKVANGRMVCAKKDDKPAKSIKNKRKHLDMECCLDPDEYPNPHCYYDPDKYGKYL